MLLRVRRFSQPLFPFFSFLRFYPFALVFPKKSLNLFRQTVTLVKTRTKCFSLWKSKVLYFNFLFTANHKSGKCEATGTVASRIYNFFRGGKCFLAHNPAFFFFNGFNASSSSSYFDITQFNERSPNPASVFLWHPQFLINMPIKLLPIKDRPYVVKIFITPEGSEDLETEIRKFRSAL